MPKVSRETADQVVDAGVMIGRYSELDGYMVGFENFREDVDVAPLLVGLPDDHCQSPHWGYVVSGRITFHFADRSEIYAAGDAYYAMPGHSTTVDAGTELVEFSPVDEYNRTMEVIGRNLEALATA